MIIINMIMLIYIIMKIRKIEKSLMSYTHDND
jgi:hypothetical protein